jgi:hypothetical protein
MSFLEQTAGDSRRIWEALAFALHRVYEPLEEEDAEWTIIGSAASALQDIAVSPSELRILTTPDAFEIWSVHLWDWLDEEPDTSNPNQAKLSLTVEHAPITVFVREPRENEQGILLEGVGGTLWGVVGRVRFQNWLVPVVPLEVQFATTIGRMLRNPQQDSWRHLASKLAQALYNSGYYRELLDEALNPYGADAGSAALELIRAHVAPHSRGAARQRQ